MGAWHGCCGLQCIRVVSDPRHVSGPLISAGPPNLLQSATLSQTAALAAPAAQYVRMSTEHQRYSTENQADAIAQYATRWGFEIVRTYADHGKSGLRLEGRDALRQLLSDVHSGNTGF